jgi:hypothetical protein
MVGKEGLQKLCRNHLTINLGITFTGKWDDLDVIVTRLDSSVMNMKEEKRSSITIA